MRRTPPLAALATAALLVSPAVAAGDGTTGERGRLLYEANCASCHSASVHGREKRVAGDFSEVRAWVERWNANLKLAWGADELDDVAVYLNRTYYHFPCPPTVCKVVSLARGEQLMQVKVSGRGPATLAMP